MYGYSFDFLPEKVHSQGKVLGDRSVLYKYSNPNLVALAAVTAHSSSSGGTATEEALSKTSGQLTIVLLDAITGQLIYSGLHGKASGPVHMVHCENWIVVRTYVYVATGRHFLSGAWTATVGFSTRCGMRKRVGRRLTC